MAKLKWIEDSGAYDCQITFESSVRVYPLGRRWMFELDYESSGEIISIGSTLPGCSIDRAREEVVRLLRVLSEERQQLWANIAGELGE